MRGRSRLQLQFHERPMTKPSATQKAVGIGGIPGWLLALSLSLLVSVVIVLPFFWYGSASGHDFEFHADSWFDVAQQWKEGVLYPRWTAWTNHGFGEPRFVFYPPLSWMLGAALTRLMPLTWVPVAFIVLTQTFAGLAAFLLLKRLTSDRGAILGAACYAMNPNALLMTYIRSDFAEQLACAMFPLVLLGALRLCNYLQDSESGPSSIVYFALPFAGVWLSNAPAGVIASYSIALLMAWAAISQRSLKIAVRGACGLALGLSLTGFYLIPAAYEQHWVNIGQALSSGLLPSQNFLFTAIEDVEHTWFNWIASTCALMLVLLLGISALLSGRLGKRGVETGTWRNAWAALLVVGAAATVLMLRFTLPLWNLLPKLRFVQFPWRWMSMVALIFACFAAAVCERRRGWLLFAVTAVVCVPMGHLLVSNGWWDTDEMPTQYAAIERETGFDGTDEYDPLGDEHSDLPVGAPLVKILPESKDSSGIPEAQAHVVEWKTEKKEIRVDAKDNARVALRLLNYPAWRVAVNGRAIAPERMDDFNVMVIPVQRGNSVIQVWFARTADRTVGMVASAIAMMVAIGLVVWGKNRNWKMGNGN
jgi:6-pyruvoyl-tetrahydropterin synthase related domain